eukprot:scaffold1.g5496.t1
MRCFCGLLLLLCLAAGTACCSGSAAGANETAPLITAATAAGSAEHEQRDLLKWALSQSDPATLRQQAEQAKRREDAAEVAERQARVAQLLDHVRQQPTEAELVREAAAIAGNASEPAERRLNALEALCHLVEDIDNANQLHALGGLAPVAALLDPGATAAAAAAPFAAAVSDAQAAALAAAAARTVRTAAANNAAFQAQLLEHAPEALQSLLALLAGTGGDTTAQALAALGAIVRNSGTARGVLYRAGGIPHLQLLLRDGGAPLRLRRCALGLLADLLALDAEALAAAGAKGTAPGLDAPAAVHAALGLLATEGGDHDLHEKALLLLRALLEREPAAAGLLHEAGAATQLAELAAQLAAETAAAGGGNDVAGGVDGGEEGEGYLQELIVLVGEVQRRLAAQPQAHAEL